MQRLCPLILAVMLPLSLAASDGLDLLPAPKAAKVGEGRVALGPATYALAGKASPQTDYTLEVLATIFDARLTPAARPAVTLRLAAKPEDLAAAARKLNLPAAPADRWQEAFVLDCGLSGPGIRLTGGPAGLIYGAYALSHLRRHDGARVTAPRCAVSDWPTLLTRAYTGVPRDPDDPSFLRNLDWLARWRINACYYEIYGDEGQDSAPEEVTRIHEECGRRGIRLYGQISYWRTALLLKREPCASKPEDVERFRRYSRDLLDRGCDGLILLFDDITQAAVEHPMTCPLCKEKLGNLAATQLELVRPVLEEGRKRGIQHLIVCPTPYFHGWRSTYNDKLDGTEYYRVWGASPLLEGVQVYHCQFRANEIAELEQAGLRNFIYWCNGFHLYDQYVPEAARVPGLWGGLNEAPFGWYTHRWDSTQGIVASTDAYEAFRALPKLTQHAWLCAGGDFGFALWGCYCWDSDRFAGIEPQLVATVYGEGTAEPYAAYKDLVRSWHTRLQNTAAVTPDQREAFVAQLDSDAARVEESAAGFEAAATASPDSALDVSAREATAAQMRLSGETMRQLAEQARASKVAVRLEDEVDIGNGVRERRMSIGDFWTRFGLRYSQTTDADGTKHRTQWHSGSGLGMTGPSYRNWYDAGFMDVLVNGQSLDAFTPTSERIAGQAGDELRATWPTEAGALSVRFSMWQGGLRMVGRWEGDPQAKLAVRLFTIPGAGWGSWTDMDKFVTTPSGTTPHGTPVTLQPDERWLFLADNTYDLPHEHAEGPCGVLFGDPLPAVTCDNGSYVVQVDADYPVGTKEFRLVVWDFHGMMNDEGLKTLRGIAAPGELP